MKDKLKDVKSLVTLSLTLTLIIVVIGSMFGFIVNDNVFLLFTNAITMIYTYFFTKKETK